jgi:hypothetical protein
VDPLHGVVNERIQVPASPATSMIGPGGTLVICTGIGFRRIARYSHDQRHPELAKGSVGLRRMASQLGCLSIVGSVVDLCAADKRLKLRSYLAADELV